MEAKAEKLIKRLDRLKRDHSKFTKLWNTAARFCMPNALNTNQSAKLNQGMQRAKPIDSTGIDCATLLAAFIYSNTVYSSEQWFELRDSNQAGIPQVDRSSSEFLQSLASKALEVINNSNFDHIYRQFTDYYVVFGTGIFHWELEQEKLKLHCRQWGIQRSIYIAENSKGEIDTVFREFEFTARQAVQEFGYDKLSDKIKDAYNDLSKQEESFIFVQCVYPREEKEIDKEKATPNNKKYADIYIEKEEKNIVLDGGRDSFPYCVARFYNKGEVYGRSAAMNASATLVSIALAKQSYIRNLEFNARPMVFAPEKIFDKIDIAPDTVNPWDSNVGDLKIWAPSGDMNSPLNFIEQEKDAVRRIFYVDRIQYLEDKKNMTATEANLRYDEMIQSFSPVLSALQSEFFTPFIEGLCQEIISKGLIKVPEHLMGDNGSLNFDVEYKSRLNTKLKAAESTNLLTFVRLVGEYAQIIGDPTVAKVYLNDKSILEKLAVNTNVSAIALKSEEEIVATQQALQEQQQAQQMQDSIKQVDVQAGIDPNSILAKGGIV